MHHNNNANLSVQRMYGSREPPLVFTYREDELSTLITRPDEISTSITCPDELSTSIS